MQCIVASLCVWLVYAVICAVLQQIKCLSISRDREEMAAVLAGEQDVQDPSYERTRHQQAQILRFGHVSIFLGPSTHSNNLMMQSTATIWWCKAQQFLQVSFLLVAWRGAWARDNQILFSRRIPRQHHFQSKHLDKRPQTVWSLMCCSCVTLTLLKVYCNRFPYPSGSGLHVGHPGQLPMTKRCKYVCTQSIAA